VFELEVNNAKPYDLTPSVIWCNDIVRDSLHLALVSAHGRKASRKCSRRVGGLAVEVKWQQRWQKCPLLCVVYIVAPRVECFTPLMGARSWFGGWGKACRACRTKWRWVWIQGRTNELWRAL